MTLLPEKTTPEELARSLGWSERRVREMARGLGACRVLGNRMIFLNQDVAAIRAAIDENRLPPTNVRDVGAVYFVRSQDGFVKVGWSSNWRMRIANIQTSIPQKLEVLAVYRRSRSFEGQLHEMFAPFRVRPDGEWFRDCDAIRIYIAARRRYCLSGSSKTLGVTP